MFGARTIPTIQRVCLVRTVCVPLTAASVLIVSGLLGSSTACSSGGEGHSALRPEAASARGATASSATGDTRARSEGGVAPKRVRRTRDTATCKISQHVGRQ